MKFKNQKFIFALGFLIFFAHAPQGMAQTAEMGTEPPPPPAASVFPYKKTFVVSSYYSPLPNQSAYFRGSYDADIRLNGEGVHMADGTKVFAGAAASSKEFPFGTKMLVPGFGLVSIHDRGGAIKNNRLDLWMGEGEEGLRRALGWGMRTLEVTVYGLDDSLKESVSFDAVPKVDLTKFLVQTEHFKVDLAEGDSGPEVAELQKFLAKTGFFDAPQTGYFGEETRRAVTHFQIELRLIASESDSAAGNFGPRSRVALEELLQKDQTAALQAVPAAPLQKGDSGDRVRALQALLSKYGFPVTETARFDSSTAAALLAFQIERSLLAGAQSKGAGFYGAQTQAALRETVKNQFVPSVAFARSHVEKKVFSQEVALNDSGPAVTLLQEELARLNFMRVPSTGFFGKTTKNAVLKFQLAEGVLESESEPGAGAVGPKTLAKLNEIASSRIAQNRLIAKTSESSALRQARVAVEKSLVSGTALAQAFEAPLGYGSRGAEVQALQKVLKRLGFFQGRLTTQYFGDITKLSLVAFQKNHGIAETGELNEQTRRVLKQITGEA